MNRDEIKAWLEKLVDDHMEINDVAWRETAVDAVVKLLRPTGMSLRDYFAGQALAGIKACSIVGDHHIDENTAKYAYALADAMLAERMREKTK